MEIRFLGHAAFELINGDTTVLIDPFLTGNPKASTTWDQLEPEVILLTHGHGDHLGDTVQIAKRTGAIVVAITELAEELSSDIADVRDPNLGGTVNFDWGWVKLLPAWHTSTTPKGTSNTPAGLLVNFGGRLIYHLGDTCLFSDLKLATPLNERIDVALVPIGGHYTMDRFDAVRAVELIDPVVAIPIHYNTFPPIESDASAFGIDVENTTGTQVQILEPGNTFSPK